MSIDEPAAASAALGDDLLALAATVAREAGALVLAGRRGGVQSLSTKSTPTDMVTEFDRASERLIVDRLTAARPHDAIVGEEGTATDGTSGVRWLVDPIDGTTNFLYDLPGYAISIAAADGDGTLAGVVYVPSLDELFAARRGQGASRNGRQIRVSGRSDPGRSAIGAAYTFKASMEGYLTLVDGMLRAGLDHRRLGSSALMLGHTADGRLDGVAMIYCHAWDVIGGLLLVEEAGGIASNFLADAGLTVPGPAFAGTPALRPTLERLTGLKAARG